MQRIIVSFLSVLCLLGLAGYAAGLFTGEVRKEESCLLCRATRYTGNRYGFSYERVESSPMTEWYRSHLDSQHGLDSQHRHVWRQCAATTHTSAGSNIPTYEQFDSARAPLLLLRPEIERSVLEQIPTPAGQLEMIHALNDPDRKAVAQRIRSLIEYYYILRETTPWPQWWAAHSSEFVAKSGGLVR